jgi:glutamine amidotransferase
MIAIIDYQMGNLRSVQKGFESAGHKATITSSAADVLKADKVVLPGVGAFRDAMRELRERDLVEPIRQVIADGKPFLGICLGLQLLFESSAEGGDFEGLGVIPGDVRKFELPREYKVPHMGWNEANILKPAPILKDVTSGSHFYFVHSFFAVPSDPRVTAIEADYHEPFCAMIWDDKNLFATQFHPEKSQADGLRILKNFAEL